MKDKSFLVELILTSFLFYLLIFLLKEALLVYGLYLIFGLIFGFCFSWFIQGKPNLLNRLFMNFLAFGIFIWLIYSLLNSSLLYRDVIRIFIKGALFLAVVFSFNAYNLRSLICLQVLSVPLFMCVPLFIKDYNAISIMSISGYFIGWFTILKVKFYGFFKPPTQKQSKRYHSLYLAVMFFILTAIFSRVLFLNFPLKDIKTGGFFSVEGPAEEAGIEKEYYVLQDKVQGEIARLIPQLNSTEERYEVLALLSSLIKESPYTLEVDKAELGLINHIPRPGPGLEKKDTEELTILIKNYVDKKIILNLKRAKDNMMDVLKKYLFDIKNRISILSRVNKIQYSDSYQKVLKYEKELKKNINDAFLSAAIKREAGEITRRLKEWKRFELYRKKMDSLNKNIGSLAEELKDELADLPSEIRELRELSDFKETSNKLKNLKETMPSQFKEPLKEILDLKLEMALSGKARNLKDKLEASRLSGDKIMELKEGVDDIEDAQGYQDLSKNSAELKERIAQEEIDISKEAIENLLEIKIYRLVKEKKEKIEDMLKEGILSDAQRENFLKDLEELEAAQDAEKLISTTKRLEATIDKFLNQGFIRKEVKDNLAEEIEELADLLLFQLRAKEKESTNEGGLSSAQKKWEEMIEKSALREETKEALKRLTEELAKVDTLAKLENIRQAIEKELEGLAKEGLKKEVERFKEAFKQVVQMQRMYVIDKILFNLRKNIEKLKEIDSQESEILKEHLKKIRNSSTEEEFKKRLEALKKHIESKELKKEERIQEEELSPFWQIYIMPSRLVVPVGSSVLLRAIGVYNNMFVKEPGPELEWFSSDPTVAWVDEKGLVYSLFKGEVKISARYRGKIIEGAEVVVLDRIAKGIEERIKKDLVR